VRAITAAAWVIHAFAWQRAGGDQWMTMILGGVVLNVYLAVQLFRDRWDQFLLPAATILVILAGPGDVLIGAMRSAPVGLLAVIGSFLLFALGTAAALTKHRWHGPVADRKGSS